MMFGMLGLVHILTAVLWFVVMCFDGFYTGGVVSMVVWALTSAVWFFLCHCAMECEKNQNKY